MADAATVDEHLIEYAVAVLRSNQDMLLHKVKRSQVVVEQLAINRTAITRLREALGYD